MDSDEQTLQIEDGALEADVACFRVHLTGVAELERCERTVLCERLPNCARVLADAAFGVEAIMVAGHDRRFAHGEKMRQTFQRDQSAATAEIFRVESAATPGQLVLPSPQHHGIFVPYEIQVRV